MKTKVLLLFALLFTTSLFAQESSRNKFEVGIGCAPFISSYIIKEDCPNSDIMFAAYMEYRRELGRHFDIGIRSAYKNGPYNTPEYSSNGYASSINLFAVTDFNILPDKAVNPFLGIVAGPTFSLNAYDISDKPSFIWGVGAGPRIGVRIKNHLTISTDTYICVFGNSDIYPLFLNIGWTF